GPGGALPVVGEVVGVSGVQVDGSLPTGEPDAVRKEPGHPRLPGSFAVAGTGVCRATAVGTAAYAARLAEEASRFHLAHSELRDGVARFIRYITWLVIPIGALLTYSRSEERRVGKEVR